MKFMKQIPDKDIYKVVAKEDDYKGCSFHSNGAIFKKWYRAYINSQVLEEDEEPRVLHYQDFVKEAASRWCENIRSNYEIIISKG